MRVVIGSIPVRDRAFFFVFAPQDIAGREAHHAPALGYALFAWLYMTRYSTDEKKRESRFLASVKQRTTYLTKRDSRFFAQWSTCTTLWAS